MYHPSKSSGKRLGLPGWEKIVLQKKRVEIEESMPKERNLQLPAREKRREASEGTAAAGRGRHMRESAIRGSASIRKNQAY